MINEELIELSLPYKGNSKTVRVFVPEHDEDELMPVIYMTDGQNLFDDGRPGQLGCWYTREAVREERRKNSRAAVIVGIHNDEGQIRRACDLTFGSIGAIRFPEEMPLEIRKLMIPNGESFVEFVIETVMTEIEERFPVLTGRENIAFCGSSLGGLMSYYTVMSRSDIFCMGGVFSPAFSIYAAEDVIDRTRRICPNNAPHLYVYSGSGDVLEQEICESTQAVVKAISGFYPKEKLNVKIRPEQRHHESAWAAEFKEFLHLFLNNQYI